jgi:C1A family cysteine protease
LTILVCCLILATGAFASANEAPTVTSTESLEEVQRMIEEQGLCWEAGETSVSGLSDEEKAQLLGLIVPPEYLNERGQPHVAEPLDSGDPARHLPSSWDWRDHNGVTPARNQGGCGSCWAFCAQAALEAMVLIYDGIEYDLSEQQILSCNYAGQGCDGGWMTTAYEVFMDPGSVLEECMPYTANDQIPCTQHLCEVVAQIDGYHSVPSTIGGIKQAIYEEGPIAVAMAVLNNFFYYSGGCYQNDNPGSINHGVLLLGWDDSMCGGQGAWIGKNSWGPGWGENGFFYIRYGDCYIGYGGAALEYTPKGPRLEYVSYDIDDSAGNGNGVVDPGESIVMSVTVENTGGSTAQGVTGDVFCTAATVTLTDATAEFPDVASGSSGTTLPPHFSFEVSPDAELCTSVEFDLSVSCDGGDWDASISINVGQQQVVLSDEFEEDGDWVVGAPDDDATGGVWVRCDPNGTYDSYGNTVQPEYDRTPGSGEECFVTGNWFMGHGQNKNDVDGGKTTLFSPVFDLSSYQGAIVTYYRWYTNDTGSGAANDAWAVDVTDDGWVTHHSLESTGESTRSWTLMEFCLGDYIGMTDQVQLRFVASDYDPDSVVEAGIDDFTLVACGGSDQEPPEVLVLSPNGGEIWQPLSQQEITWEATDNVAVDHVDIYLSTDAGQSYPDPVALGEENDGVFDWLVPDLMTDDAMIKVVAFDTSLLEGSDESDDVFTIGPETGVGELPRALALHQSIPNPFRPSTSIAYDLPRSASVRLTVYDLAGRAVRALVDRTQDSGSHEASWDGRDDSGRRVGAGVYFYKLIACDRELTRKVVLIE